VWPAEIKKWSLNHLTYSILHGKDKKARLQRRANIDMINVENIFWLLDDLPDDYDTLVIDESSKFKNYSSKRFKVLKKKLNNFEQRIILTGTPSPNSLMDLYSQIYILDQGEALGRNITAYRKSYFYPSMFRNFIEWNLKAGADQVIQRRVAPLVDRIDAETNLDLPELVEHTIEVSLSEADQEIYKSFEKQLFAQIGKDNFTLASAASAYNTCRQIANGRFYEPPEPMSDALSPAKRKVIQLHGLKVEALRELIGELQGKPLLVAYHYRHDLAQLLETFGEKTPVLGSKTSAKQGAQLIKKWNAGELPLLLGHPASMGHGINLQFGGSDIAWFSLTDNLENYIQFNRRIYRQGALGQTRVHHFVAKGTVDEAVMTRLKSKDANQRALLNALLEYGKKRNA
jgi:SNF2 family DNA or RNA helicase